MSENAHAILRLAVYARVSTEEQREGQTIDSQLSELERFSREKGWPIAGVYKDEGWSGGVMARPELDRLRDDARKGLFDAMVVNDVDRLARDVAHLGVIKRDLERHGITVIFRKLPSDGSPTYNLMVNILGSFAEFERELIADRTRRGSRHKVEIRKQYLGSNTSYGYRYIRQDRQAGREGLLEIVPEQTDVVQRMFTWVDEEGLSARGVVRRLNELKIPPKKGAAHWARSSVLRILKNEMYAGTWHYGKHQSCEPKNQGAQTGYRKSSKSSIRLRPRTEWLPLLLHESLQIVPRDRWQRVQDQLVRNTSFSPRNEKHRYLLKGLVRCGACGARYVGNPSHGRFFYRCMKSCKQMPTITERKLNQTVQRAVAEVMLDPELILGPLRELEASGASVKRQRQRKAAEIERESQRVETEEQRVLDAYRLEIISPMQLSSQLEQLKVRKTQIDLQRKEIEETENIPLEQAEKTVSEYCAEAAGNLASFTDEQWHEFLRTLIQSITFDGDHITIRGHIPVEGRKGEVPFERAPAVPAAQTPSLTQGQVAEC